MNGHSSSRTSQRRPKMRSPLAAFSVLLVPAIVGLLSGASMGAEVARPYSGRDILLVIQTDRTTYHVGDPIMLRIGLKNTLSDTAVIVNRSPWQASNLLIWSESGQRVKPVAPKDHNTYSHIVRFGINPGETVMLDWLGKEWVGLDHWGYSLTRTGTYTIVGMPYLREPYMEPDDTTVRSNKVQIEILP